MYAVFLDEPTVNADDLVAVFAAAGFRTALDARAAARRAAGGVVADEIDAASAARLCDALVHRGFSAAVVDGKDVALPPAQHTKEVVVNDGVVEVADSLGRLVSLPFADLALLAAIRARVVTTEPSKAAAKAGGPSGLGKVGSVAMSMALPGAQTAAKMIKAVSGGNATSSTAMAEREETFVELVFQARGPGDATAAWPLRPDRLKRLRLDDNGVVFRAGGPRSLAQLAALLEQRAPVTTARQRGFVALCAGEVPPALKSLREFDREVAWAFWSSWRRAG